MAAQWGSDGELVAQATAGNDDAFAELVRRHHPRAIALCLAMLGDASAAEDAAQEAFLLAHRALKDFRGDATFSTWLYRIAANKCRDYRRKEARERTESLDAVLEENSERVRRFLAVPSAERSTENEQLVEQVLSCLPDAYRLVLVLREVNGLTYEEIAEATSCTVESVRARLRRARGDFLDRVRHLAPPEDV